MTAAPTTTTMPVLLRVPEMARALGVSAKRGYELLTVLPAGAVVRLGRQVRVRQDALVAWIEAGGTAGGAA